MKTLIPQRRYRAYGQRSLEQIDGLRRWSRGDKARLRALAAVFPFRVNAYVIDDLIRWDDVPNDPIYQLTFPQPGMLSQQDLECMTGLVMRGAPSGEIDAAARRIQMTLNPHPSGQLALNSPELDGRKIPGIQHKYRETVLFFPSQGQTCHAYCTYCFRWAQFVGIESLKYATQEISPLVEYLRVHPDVTDVLITGGDPLIMRTEQLRGYVEPLLSVPHLNSIRIGTKAPAFWPYRFITDGDADALMTLFEDVRKAGENLAIMAHYSHPRELETDAARMALRRIQSTGAVVRCQAPLIRYVNDSAEVWARLWRTEARLGAVPYYMFMARDTGPNGYFGVPLARGTEIFQDASRQLAGLARCARGPVMSATPGKVLVNGIAQINGERVFALQFLAGRDDRWVGRTFFARFDPDAMWLNDLRPLEADGQFFFETTPPEPVRGGAVVREINAGSGRIPDKGARRGAV
jgi:KamA family protein